MNKEDFIEHMNSIHDSENSVELVWATPFAEEIIAFCARVSNPNNQLNFDTAEGLLKYCAENSHCRYH